MLSSNTHFLLDDIPLNETFWEKVESLELVIPPQVKFFLSGLNIPISIYECSSNHFKLVNQSFIDMSGLTQQECYTAPQDRLGHWIDMDDHAIIDDSIEGTLSKICKDHVHFNTDQLSFMINARHAVKNKNGEDRNLLIQSHILSWKDNLQPELILDLYTDINHRKFSNKIVFTVNHWSNSSGAWNMIFEDEYVRVPAMLGKREREILGYMLNDLSATQIAEKLNISFYTVRAHWRNILSKTQCRTRKEVRYLAQIKGWI